MAGPRAAGRNPPADGPAADAAGVKVHDVTAPLGPETRPWPGDTPFELAFTARIGDGDACNVSAITTSPHTGTHADAPLHVADDGAPVDRLPLEPFLGPALVLDRDEALGMDADGLARAVPRGFRVLLRSGRGDHRDFPERIPGVPPAWIGAVAERGTPLLGVDLPSLDPVDSRELAAHHACLRHGIQVLENLALADVTPGRYRLAALPLRLEGADASPVRAVLIEE